MRLVAAPSICLCAALFSTSQILILTGRIVGWRYIAYCRSIRSGTVSAYKRRVSPTLCGAVAAVVRKNKCQ